MNRYAMGILILAICSSCTVYRTDVFHSDIAGKPDEPFTFEDDTLRFSYSFPNGMTVVEVFNKSSGPLYVDWSRSARIVDGESIPYGASGSPVSFIPPGSGLTRPLFEVIDYEPVYDRKPVRHLYTEKSSPMKFRSYLFLSFDQDFYEWFALDHTFWLAERRQTREPNFSTPRQNAYTTSLVTEDGGAAATVVGILIGIPVVWLCLNSNTPDDTSTP